jgi:putative nucleotidyltransferase with HDIG domain
MDRVDTELQGLVNRIADPELRGRVFELLDDPTIDIDDRTYRGVSFDASPAAKRAHHAHLRGLLQHTVAASKIALTLCDVVEEVYHSKVERDVVIASIVLHDCMKPLTYTMRGERSYDSSPLGEMIDHLTLVATELIRRGFPLEVVHAVTAHHGRDGPIGPHTIEGLICFLADDTDANLAGQVTRAAEYLIRDCLDERPGQLTTDEALAIVHAKQVDGCVGVRKAFASLVRDDHPSLENRRRSA